MQADLKMQKKSLDIVKVGRLYHIYVMLRYINKNIKTNR